MGGKRRKCVICGRMERYRSGFFANFPSDEARCRIWVKVAGDEDLAHLPIELLRERRHICSDHFEKKYFNRKGNRLKKEAYPTLKLCASPLTDEQMIDFPLHLKSTFIEKARSSDHSYTKKNYHLDHNYAQGTVQSQIEISDVPSRDMAIVEDEVRGSEEENEMEVVAGDDGEPDSDDSDDDDDKVLEHKVTDLEHQITEDPYNYDKHIELIQALWRLSELDRWRSAFDRLQEMTLIKPEHWLLRLKTEETLSHSDESRENVVKLFQQATLDCYSIQIYSEWCTWALSFGNTESAREQIDEVLKRAGADPLSGKVFWDAKLEMEKAKLESMSMDDQEYNAQRERVLWCVEEVVSRPLLRGADAWPQLEELALVIHDQHYLDKVKLQHEAATEYLEKITPYEDKLLTIEDPEKKCKVYQEYIATVKELSQVEKYAECDSDGILKVLYDRATTECVQCSAAGALLAAGAAHAARVSSRDTLRRVLRAAARRRPRTHTFWALLMQQAERDDATFDEVKTIFETALAKGMESYKEAELLWLSYLEFTRRQTDFTNETEVERLRRTFRLAWDSLAFAWGDEANDCEVPLFWARLEYKRMNDAKQGKEIFDEIFKYGENRTLCKYWEALISLEASSGANPRRLRDLMSKGLRAVVDYPPSLARLWTDYERDHGDLKALLDCKQAVEAKLQEWRDNYQAMKDKMMGSKNKGKPPVKKTPSNVPKKPSEVTKKTPSEVPKKKPSEVPKKEKRKSDGSAEGSKVKKTKKKETEMDVDPPESTGAQKRPHNEEDETTTETKRARNDSESEVSGSREACTLFVSNLDFKVNEDNLRNKLSEFGEIVSMRVKAGVKAFGGSICYCQYRTPGSVERALKHDRTPLDGRPMFLSRYSANKSKPSFKYATTVEKHKLFVRNLPFSHCTNEALTELFSKYGALKDIRVVTFKDGKPKGLAYVEFCEESCAAAAVEGADGQVVGGRAISVAVSAPPQPAAATAVTTLGQQKRGPGDTMRRTQLSSFIPSVLQKPSTSKSTANGSHTNGAEKRPLSNSDFRNMLLNK